MNSICVLAGLFNGLGWQQYAVGGNGVPPTLVVVALAPKTTVGVKPGQVI